VVITTQNTPSHMHVYSDRDIKPAFVVPQLKPFIQLRLKYSATHLLLRNKSTPSQIRVYTDREIKHASLVRQTQGTTRTDDALATAGHLFARSKRYTALKIAVVLTDGQSDYPHM